MVGGLILDVERRRRACEKDIDPQRRSELGQFFTPPELACFMAGLFDVTARPCRLLDPGAGVGSLAAAAAVRWQAEGGGPLDVTAVESDPRLRGPLARTMGDLGRLPSTTGAAVDGDFTAWGAARLSSGPLFDLAIVNPPYRKIRSSSPQRRRLAAAGIEAPNLYAGFVALAAGLLAPGGQIVAITPRSFTNGPYFRKFRRWLLDRIGIRRIHVFESRDAAFADSGVLQENVVIHAARGPQPDEVVVSSSLSAPGPAKLRTVPYGEMAPPGDPEAFIHLALDEASARHARRARSLPCSLEDLGLAVSTGPVVDFRVKGHLRREFSPGTVPLVYPAHLRNGRVGWPNPGGRKPNALVRCEETESSLTPSGGYVLVRRLSAKEERRRVTATALTPDALPGSHWAFENHLNVIHRSGRGLPPRLARGMAAFLNTTTVDQFLRQFNGHTQVNATDLRSFRYPEEREMEALGDAAHPGMRQDAIDDAANRIVSAFRRLSAL